MLAAAATSNPSNTGLIYDFLLHHLGATDFQARFGQVVAVKVFRVALVLLLAAVVSRVGSSIIRRAVQGLRLRVTPGSAAATARAEDRSRTVAFALSGAFRAFVWVIAVLTVLGELGLQLTPFVAGATVIGAALGFGAQSLVRDFLSGFLILVEDQYGVGDVITVGDTTGTVESLNFRTTRVRAVDGVVWYIPNGEIRKVGNTSDEFNRAVVDVVMPWKADVHRAMDVIREAAESVTESADVREAVIDRPEVWGIDTVSADGVTVKVAVKTLPTQRALVSRALRSGIIAALQESGLGWSSVED